MPDSDTIHALFTTLEMTLFMRATTLFTTLHRQHAHYTKTHINTTTMNIH